MGEQHGRTLMRSWQDARGRPLGGLGHHAPPLFFCTVAGPLWQHPEVHRATFNGIFVTFWHPFGMSWTLARLTRWIARTQARTIFVLRVIHLQCFTKVLNSPLRWRSKLPGIRIIVILVGLTLTTIIINHLV